MTQPADDAEAQAPVGPEDDEGVVSLGDNGGRFLDFLYAFLAVELFRWFLGPHDEPVTAAAFAHQALAGTLIVTSFLGYHTSSRRPRQERIVFTFTSIPLWLFFIHLALMGLYWILVLRLAEGAPDASDASARGEAAVLFASFSLYWVWEELAGRIRDAALSEGVRKTRTQVTALFAIVSGVIFAAIFWFNPQTENAVAWVGISLIVYVVGYRFIKEYAGRRAACSRRVRTRSPTV